jgi:hypothetical protein
MYAGLTLQMKWYIYGRLGHPPMVCHVDGMYREYKPPLKPVSDTSRRYLYDNVG